MYQPHFNGEVGEQSSVWILSMFYILRSSKPLTTMRFNVFPNWWINARFMMRIVGQELHNYKSVGLVKDKKFGAQNRTKPYLALVNQPNHHYNSQKTTINHPSGGGSVGSALSTPWRCRKCGCTNHATWDFKDKEVTCFNCGNHRYIGRDCPSSK